MPRQRKFRPGRVVESLDDLAHCINVGCWFYWPTDSRPKHPSIIANQQFRTIMIAVRNGRLKVAETIIQTEGAQT